MQTKPSKTLDYASSDAHPGFSKWGLLSFCIGLATFLTVGATLSALMPVKDALWFAVFLIGVTFSTVGILFGIWGARWPHERVGFAVIGIIVNILQLLLSASLLILN